MYMLLISVFFIFFFFNDTATTEIYTLSLHDALPIWMNPIWPYRLNPKLWLIRFSSCPPAHMTYSTSSEYSTSSTRLSPPAFDRDRKSTRLNSSHSQISYAVFCLKKKKKNLTLVDCVG